MCSYHKWVGSEPSCTHDCDGCYWYFELELDNMDELYKKAYEEGYEAALQNVRVALHSLLGQNIKGE